MKLAVAIADDNALPSAFVVWRGFERSISKAAAYGYNGVELALKSAAEVNTDKMDRWLADSGLEVSCVTSGQVFSDGKYSLTDPDRHIREATLKALTDLLPIAAHYGKMMNLGRVRGAIHSPDSREYFLEAMRVLCGRAKEQDVEIIVEPVNRYEINFINNLDEGSAIIEQAGLDNLGLMPDVFHMNIEDDHIGQSLIRNAKHIKYVHLADSNRHAPGWGHMPFREIFDALQSIRYAGWCSVEIFPVPDPDRAAKQACGFLRPFIEKGNRCR